MRNMRHMNQVKRARCSTAMFTQSPFFPSLRRLVGLCEDFFQDPYCLRKGKLKKHCVRLHFRYNCFDAETRSIFGRLRLQVKSENRSRSKTDRLRNTALKVRGDQRDRQNSSQMRLNFSYFGKRE